MSDISLSDFMKDASELAHRAISQDKSEHFDVAIYFYRESISLLERTRKELLRRLNASATAPEQGSFSSDFKNDNDNPWKDRLKGVEIKIFEYQGRVNDLEKIIHEKEMLEKVKANMKSKEELLFERAKFLVSQALNLEEDSIENDEDTVKLYVDAVQLCLDAKSGGKLNDTLANQIAKLAGQALERAEKLKKSNASVPKNAEAPSSSSRAADLGKSLASTSTSVSFDKDDHYTRATTNALSAHAGDINMKISGTSFYTEQEKRVLLLTSKINTIDYLPFMQVDLKEIFAYHLPFTDRDGMLGLSPKQRKHFTRWARPDEIWASPKMIERIDCFSIKQTVISDCSFVASLSVSALYEKRFNKKLITSIIYPQNKAGQPVFNPCGKYMVKFILNGVPRKVVVDDYLPVGQHGELLCSYSNNKGELWVSLLEKAYMKVMGGYDFPGSNSNIDLHALTGWIPERLSIHAKEPEPFDKEKTFRKLFDRMRRGDVLVTVATGDIGEKEAERAGLVPTHAYAVLDIREVKGVRLFLVKNPWSHLRWRGNYSELDAAHWTEEMKTLLSYDPNSASMFDNGVFWIDYDSICKFFDVFYMNWNPALFNYTGCIHKTWSAGAGPVKDVYNISENPQYKLEVKSTSPAAVWILLTRHITELHDFKENKEYITVLVYDTDGRRVYYPYEPPPIMDGVRINSPHYLCKIVLPEATSKRYTLVVSQYEKTHTLHYTLRAYASCPIQLQEIQDLCKFQKRITGEWKKGTTAGGCINHPETYKDNPCYQIALNSSSNTNTVVVELKGPKAYHVGFDVICSNVSDPSSPGFFNKKSSGSYRPGFVVLELERIPSGIYNIIPSTFQPGCEGPFFLKVKSSSDFTMRLL